MSDINFQRTYLLGEAFEDTKKRAIKKLSKYLSYPNLVTFNDGERSVTFSSEKLIPTVSTNRPRIMLLFSNPHPHSVAQGMFLSPNTKGRENLFWSVMEEAGWLSISEEIRTSKQLVNICVEAKYQGPFELIFNCYYAFPTDFPKDIKKIFGREYFSQIIEPEAKNEFKEIIQDTNVDAVVIFNKGIFNVVSENQIARYIECLVEGELVQSQIKGIDRCVPVFLTYPTGWRYRKQYRELRKSSLDKIRMAICNDANVPKKEEYLTPREP